MPMGRRATLAESYTEMGCYISSLLPVSQTRFINSGAVSTSEWVPITDRAVGYPSSRYFECIDTADN
jgi:hypothetical protein